MWSAYHESKTSSQSGDNIEVHCFKRHQTGAVNYEKQSDTIFKQKFTNHQHHTIVHTYKECPQKGWISFSGSFCMAHITENPNTVCFLPFFRLTKFNPSKLNLPFLRHPLCKSIFVYINFVFQF